MSGDVHERAWQLLGQRRVEGLTREDEGWLAAHLTECGTCAGEDLRLAEAVSALRVMQIDVPRNLAGRAQLRVRLHAEQLRERGGANRLIWAVAAMSWVLGLATAPLVWRGFEWAGGEFHLPKLVWVAGVALWWIVPALAATGVVLLERRGRVAD